MQDSRARTGARLRLLALFVLVTVGFACYRNSSIVIWDDSPGVYSDERMVQRKLNPTAADIMPLGESLTLGFVARQGPGYRPMAEAYHALSLLVLYAPGGPTFPHLLLVGSLYGALAVCLVSVARRFGRGEPAAYFVVLLTLGSPPLAATTWVCIAGLQAMVPLLMCLGLLCYWRATEAVRGQWFFLTCLGILLLLGPWYREFLGIMPILIGYLELRRARRPTPLMAAAAVGFLHAVFPTALIKLLFLPDLPLLPVYALGNLHAALGNQEFRWYAAAHFLPLFPPLLLLLAAVSGLTGTGARVRALLRAGPEAPGWRALLPALAFLAWLAFALALLATGLVGWLLPLTLCLGIAALGLEQDLLLPFWFLAAFLPILRVFTEHVHFGYAVVPAAIILAGAVESLWLQAASLRGPAAWLRPALAACLALVAADQTATFYGVYRVNHATYGGINDTAQWLTRQVPPGSVLVTNVIHGEEIKWHANEHFEIFWTIDSGIPDVDRVVMDPDRLKALLDQSAGKNVYLLDVDFDYLPGKVSYHQHKYIHQLEVPHEDAGVAHRTLARYVFLDPLRYLVPREYVPFLGAPDLMNDFYSGPPHELRPFTYEVSAEYHLYRVTGNTIVPLASAGPAEPHLIGALAGHNIVAYRGWHYGIPQTLGALNLTQTDVTGMPGVIRALTVGAVESEIQKLTAAP